MTPTPSSQAGKSIGTSFGHRRGNSNPINATPQLSSLKTSKKFNRKELKDLVIPTSNISTSKLNKESLFNLASGSTIALDMDKP